MRKQSTTQEQQARVLARKRREVTSQGPRPQTASDQLNTDVATLQRTLGNQGVEQALAGESVLLPSEKRPEYDLQTDIQRILGRHEPDNKINSSNEAHKNTPTIQRGGPELGGSATLTAIRPGMTSKQILEVAYNHAHTKEGRKKLQNAMRANLAEDVTSIAAAGVVFILTTTGVGAAAIPAIEVIKNVIGIALKEAEKYFLREAIADLARQFPYVADDANGRLFVALINLFTANEHFAEVSQLSKAVGGFPMPVTVGVFLAKRAIKGELKGKIEQAALHSESWRQTAIEYRKQTAEKRQRDEATTAGTFQDYLGLGERSRHGSVDEPPDVLDTLLEQYEMKGKANGGSGAAAPSSKSVPSVDELDKALFSTLGREQFGAQKQPKPTRIKQPEESRL